METVKCSSSNYSSTRMAVALYLAQQVTIEVVQEYINYHQLFKK